MDFQNTAADSRMVGIGLQKFAMKPIEVAIVVTKHALVARTSDEAIIIEMAQS